MISLMLDSSGHSSAHISKEELRSISMRPKLHWNFMERLSLVLSKQGITIYKGNLSANEFVVVKN